MASHRPAMPQELRPRLNSPLILALMASGVVFAILSPVSAQASPVNPLAELSRTLVGSSFEPTTTTTTLEGNPSLIEAGAGSVKPVVGSFVDDEVRRRPVGSSQKPGVRPAIKTVQLLIPVKTGLEFAQLQELEPTVKILEQDGKVYVLVAETVQALPVYKRGKALQEKFGYGFELAYSEGHPDLNLAWMGALSPDVASLKKPSLLPPAAATTVSASIPKAKPRVEAPKLGEASDLGLLTISASWLIGPSVSEQATPQPVVAQPVSTSVAIAPTPTFPTPTALTPTPTLPAVRRRPSNLVVVSPSPARVPSTAKAIPKPVTRSVAPLPIAISAAPASTATPASKPASPSVRRQSMQDILVELRRMRIAQAVPEQAAPSVAELPIAGFAKPASSSVPASVATEASKRALTIDQPATSSVVAAVSPIVSQASLASPSLIQAVAIRPTQLGTIPVLGTRFMAVNQELAYMFVKVKTAADLEVVRQVAPVSVIHESNGQLLAQVGVFPNTKKGDHLRDVQRLKLQNSGVEVQLIGARPFGQRALDRA